MNFRTEVCSKSKNPTRALQWIKETEAAKSLDDLITPKSVTGNDFPDYEELDLMMASASKRCYDKQTHHWKNISVDEQRAQKNNRFLRGRHVSYLIFEYFRHIGSQREYSRSSCDSERKKGPRLCVSKFRSKEVYSAKNWANEIERFGGTRYKIPSKHLVRNSNSGKKGHLEDLPKKVNLMSEIFARRRLRNEHLGKLQDKKSAPAKQHGIWREIYKLKAEDKATFLFSCENKGTGTN